MNATMKRRIQRAEKAIDQIANPEKPKEIVLLAQPAADASAELVAKFEADQGAALERGAFVIVLTPLKPVPRSVESFRRRAQVNDVPGREGFEGRRSGVS